MIAFLIRITSSTTGLKNCAVTKEIKKYKSIIKKKKKKNDKIAKSKLNSIEFVVSKALIDSVISHGEFVLINNVWLFIEDFSLLIKQCYRITWSV